MSFGTHISKKAIVVTIAFFLSFTIELITKLTQFSKICDRIADIQSLLVEQMATRKKSRKTGLIGVRKTPDFKREEKEKRSKKNLGKPAGSRNNQVKNGSEGSKGKVNKDPRLGSKKPIVLLAQPLKDSELKEKKVSHFSPEQELNSIESDQKLTDLLAQVDDGITLTKVEKNYVDKKLQRHKALCEILGIDDEIETNSEISKVDEDIFDTFEKIDVSKFKDF